VVTTAPVGAFLRITNDTAVALTSGATVPGSRLLLPGAGSTPGASGWIAVLNPGIEDVTVEVATLGNGSAPVTLPIPAGEVVEVVVSADPALGYVISGDGALVASWSTSIGGSIGVGMAASLPDE
jgi:hypothetical protein